MANLAEIEQRLADLERRVNDHLRKKPTARVTVAENTRQQQAAREAGRGT